MGDSSNVSVGGAKFLFKLLMEIFPVNKSVRLQILFLPMEHSGSPLLHSSGFYVGKGPNNFSHQRSCPDIDGCRFGRSRGRPFHWNNLHQTLRVKLAEGCEQMVWNGGFWDGGLVW